MVSHDPGTNPVPGRRLLDAADGPLHPVARQTLAAAVDAGWADPARLHTEGRRARALLDRTRDVLAAGLGARPSEVSLLPSGPTALARAVEGVLWARRRHGSRTVASAVEHSAVLVDARAREAQDAGGLGLVPVDRLGRVELDAWGAEVAAPGTVVAALQSANGEVGTRQPLAAAHEVCRRHGVPLVVDAMAGLGRDPAPTDWDVLVGDARSWGGPPLGVLVVREGTRWQWRHARADVEHGRTDVSPWVPLALAAAEAWQQTASDREADAAAAHALVDRVRRAAATVPDTEVVGDPDDRLPHVVTLSSLYVDGEALVHALDRRGIAVASGSACTSSTLEPSHVLAAMGALTHGNLRLTLPLRSVGPEREADVTAFCEALPQVVAAVRLEAGVTGL
ncbi:cysteine desulfurase [Terracoccus luteus]|uniref:Cysteine desulfurase n=1 Tax=Terracoccus luteus TaxID=53356 RepID=A0A495XZ58_9MICO|nr:aminotransferase class V-fold PLP-dependent enzyme [Terracoccus luteus]RKT77783.1 cysteine desulfurase [Terracoccus luteus]